MTALLDLLQRLRRGLGHVRFVHGQEAPHVLQRRHVLDEHRALVLARAARHAVPDRVEADGVDQRQLLGVTVAVFELAGLQRVPHEQGRADLVHLLLDGVAHVVHDLLRREFLAGEEGRAVDLAAPALRARVGVEHLLPREVLDLSRAEALEILEVLDRLQLPRRRNPAEEDVERHRQHVRVLAVRQVVQE